MRGMIAWLGLREAMLPFGAGAGRRRNQVPLFQAAAPVVDRHLLFLRAAPVSPCGWASPPALSEWDTSAGLCAWKWRATDTLGVDSLVSLPCLFFGVTLVCVSLIGDYIARCYEESKQRPLYVVNQAVNIDEAPHDTRRIPCTAQSREHHPGQPNLTVLRRLGTNTT